MNIKLYKRGGEAAEKVTKELDKGAEQMQRSAEKAAERAAEINAKAAQMRAQLEAGTFGKNQYVSPKATIKTVELKDVKSSNSDSKVISRVRNAGKRRRLNYEADPNPTRLVPREKPVQPKLSAYGEHVGVTPINRGSLEGLRLVPREETVGQKIFSKLKDNRVVNFVKKHPTLSLAALNLAGWGLGTGLAASNREENQENTDTTTSQEQIDSPGFVIGKDGTPYYYNGSDYTADFIQGSDGNIYNSQGELLGNVGNDARLAGYNDVFDYNAAKAGVDPSQVAAIQQLLGVKDDGRWGAITQAAYQNAMKKMKGNNFAIPYTIHNIVQ